MALVADALLENTISAGLREVLHVGISQNRAPLIYPPPPPPPPKS